jgi:UDP-N-acetylglucosamine diphosphorylase / glucose-1-phosphate thymidylyltransferase / UDP-N-acetylgalactosamine diphosphorylase / glucosamine-1-phosphate N-acetyltransferase / galactosamine-1-phosphate N-acetyltransferase
MRQLRTALLLAHSRGDHCFPYGGEGALRPKYAMEVATRPLLVRTIESLKSLGFERIVVATGFRSEVLESLILDSALSGVEVHQTESWLTGDALVLAEVVRDKKFNEPLLVLNADLLVHTDDIQNAVDIWTEADGEHLVVMVDELDNDEDKRSWVGVDVDGERVVRFPGHREDTIDRLTGLAIVPQANVGSLADADLGERKRLYVDSQWAAILESGSDVVAVRPMRGVVNIDRCFDYLEANDLAAWWEFENIRRNEGVYCHVAGRGEPDPRYIYPGTILSPGVRLVFEEGSFIGPYETLEAHRKGLDSGASGPAAGIRIRGNVHLGPGFRIGANSLIEGDVVTGTGGYIEDALVEGNALLGDHVRVRRGAFLRDRSVCGDGSRFECAADFSGVAGPSTTYMHPLQARIVTGRNCDLGAGCWVGTWRFDNEASRFKVGDRLVKPKNAGLANTVYFGDEVRSAVMVSFQPGTRVGADTLIGSGVVAGRDLEPGKYYELKQDVEVSPVETVRPRRLP